MIYFLLIFLLIIVSSLSVAVYFQWKFKVSSLKQQSLAELNEIILQASPLIMNIWDEDITLISTSKQSITMFGLTSEEEYIARFNELSPSHQPCGTPSGIKAMAGVKKAFEEGSNKFEWMHQTLEGEPIPTEITLERFKSNDKYMVAAYTVDLRPVKLAMKMESEKEIQDRVKLMFDAAPIIIEYWDINCNGFYCNKTALDFFGLSHPDEFSKEVQSLFGYLPDGSSIWEEWKRNLEEIIEDGSGNFEIKMKKANGEYAFLECEGICIKRFENKDDIMVVTYSRDITKMKEMQSERQRTEIAEESNRAKSKFLARMSHELRTPITAILGVSEIHLQSGDLTTQLDEAFSSIYSSANSLLGMVNDILDLSKIEVGKMDIVSEKYETANLINDISNLHLPNFARKNIRFNLVVDENLPAQLIGDSLRISQIFNNILSNACKYTEYGSVELTIDCRKDPYVSNYILLIITVKDTGIGMSKEQLESLKDEYSRFYEQEYRNIDGKGLGMPIVYSLIKMMDGHIHIESEVTKGTKITVQMPQKVETQDIMGLDKVIKLQEFKAGPPAASGKEKAENEQMPEGSLALVVDDTKANLFVAKGLLGLCGLEVETCSSGYEAIEKIKQGKTYDIILMDHMMPDMDGVETMRELRKMNYTRPIIAFTANVMAEQVDEFIKEGFDGFIAKPIQTKQLNGILSKFIKGNK